MRISPGTWLSCWNSSLIVVNGIVGSSPGAVDGDRDGLDVREAVVDIDADADLDVDEDADIDADNANDGMIA